MSWNSRIGVPWVIALGVMLGSCSHDNAFDLSGRDAFIASCVGQSARLAGLMNAAAGSYGVDVPMVAGLISAFGEPVERVDLERSFDPAVALAIAGFDRTGQPDPRKSCATAAMAMAKYGDVTPVESLRLGTDDVMNALSAEEERIRSVRAEILQSQVRAQTEAVRLRDAMDRYAPRAVTFKVTVQNGRYVPSLLVSAANVVGHPITAFLLNLRLVGADGTAVGSGRVRFVPPVPLGPGIESTYVLDLSGVAGIDTQDVVSYSGALRVVIGLDDLVVEGKPMLDSLRMASADKSRVDILQVLLSTLLRYRDTIRGAREREQNAFG